LLLQFFLHKFALHSLATQRPVAIDRVSDVFTMIFVATGLAGIVLLVKALLALVHFRTPSPRLFGLLALVLASLMSSGEQGYAADRLYFWLHESEFEKEVREMRAGASAVTVHRIAGTRLIRYFIYVKAGSFPLGRLTLAQIDEIEDAADLRGCAVAASHLSGNFYVFNAVC
jgi:hypothetical protein